MVYGCEPNLLSVDTKRVWWDQKHSLTASPVVLNQGTVI